MVAGLILMTGCSAEPENLTVSKPLGSQGEAPTETEQPAEETLVAEPGSRESPLALGTATVLDDGERGSWEITLGPAQLNATEFVLAEDAGNEAPTGGLQWAILPVSATYTGTQSGDANSSLTFTFIAEDGTAHTRWDTSGAGIWNSLGNSTQLYSGETAKGGVLIAIPSGNPEKGTWRIGWSYDEKVVYFTAE
jgi:hypothetical protein